MSSQIDGAAILREHFLDLVGSDPELEALPSERDVNIKVLTDSGAVLKVYRADDREWLLLQDAALRWLEADGLPVPRVLHADMVNLPDGRVARLVSWLDGVPWALAPVSQQDLGSLGSLVARIDERLSRFSVSASEREVLVRPFRWNMMQALALRDELPLVADLHIRDLCSAELHAFEARILPALKLLSSQVIHNDANENNILVDGASLGIIDFGDIIWAPRIVGLATAMAYAATSQRAPLTDVLPLVRGYHLASPLLPEELDIVWALVRMRLVMSVINAAVQSAADPDNDYLLISQDTVPRLLIELAESDDYLALCRLREVCGYDPSPRGRIVRDHLRTARSAPIVKWSTSKWIDWSVGSTDPRTSAGLQELLRDVDIVVGRYGEDRDVYAGTDFTTNERTIHLGLDLFQPAGTAVHAPYDAIVEAVAERLDHLDYGHAVLLRHETADGTVFWTLYGHLDAQCLSLLGVGQRVSAGERIGTMGDQSVNGGWPPHVHVQVLTDLCGMGMDVYGVAPRRESTLWRSLCPNPNLMVGIPPIDWVGSDAHPELGSAEIQTQRQVRLARNLSLNFREPLHIVRGEGAYLYDAQGQAYLDLVNNVAHVGHANSFVVEAGARQMKTLNTNTRFLHDSIVEYARSLVATLPDPLSVVFLVNSGSEANDLAMRFAHAHTKARGWLTLRHAYHGHTASVVEISPYKFLGPGGLGTSSHVRVVDLPGTGDEVAMATALSELGQPLAAFIAEGIMSTAGQVTLPEGFLAEAYDVTRAAGGVCIADEVQIGLGRVGECFWGFQLHGVIPDIVTMGKPLGNGHPLAAVVTTPAIASSFHNGMEYFNTFGGNPVSASIGQAVLDFVLDSRLQSHARDLGDYVQAQVRAMMPEHPLIADVRGHGLFLGIELRRDDQPATKEVADLIEYAKRRGVMLSSDGPANNVFKIKPPLVVQRSDMDTFLEVFSDGLRAVND